MCKYTLKWVGGQILYARTACFILAAGVVFSTAATLDDNRDAVYCSLMINNGVNGGRNTSTKSRFCIQKVDSDQQKHPANL
jgi:hypothetical protein